MAHMSQLGLTFGKVVIVPSRPHGHLVTRTAALAVACTFDPSGNFEVLRAPVGHDEWASQYTLARAGETLDLFQALSCLPSARLAFSLAEYQFGRLSYVLRTALALRVGYSRRRYVCAGVCARAARTIDAG